MLARAVQMPCQAYLLKVGAELRDARGRQGAPAMALPAPSSSTIDGQGRPWREGDGEKATATRQRRQGKLGRKAMSKVMLITGGSRGIGAATARLAARQGYDVAISYLSNEATAESVCADIRTAGRQALAVQADTA